MSDPVNLNQFRKAKARVAKSALADANSVKFGRSKAQKDTDRQVQDKATRLLDQHKRET
ncbi:DUF4169 family protein [Pseudosulfitobacter sp. SM2401]|uniref:DUF4169 family protein n=1 Tax=Pseudosulfitobacter sp. SM2401 TaxID=3350098 RepID=UPI0036F3578B